MKNNRLNDVDPTLQLNLASELARPQPLLWYELEHRYADGTTYYYSIIARSLDEANRRMLAYLEAQAPIAYYDFTEFKASASDKLTVRNVEGGAARLLVFAS